MPAERPLRAFLIAGAATGLAGVALSGLVHAAMVVPVWVRLAGGIRYAALALSVYSRISAMGPAAGRGAHA